MSKQLPYFKFYSQDWLAGKIDRQPLEIQGAFIQLVSVYWGKQGNMETCDIDYRIGDDNLDILIKKGFVLENDGEYSIPFLDEQLSDFQSVREKRSKAGIASAAARVNTCSTSVNNIEKRRGEENREENTVYLERGHLSITVEEYNKILDDGYEPHQVDDMLNRVLNYRKNTNYKSLYLTALSWLRKDKKKEEAKAEKEKPTVVPHWNDNLPIK